MGTNATSTYVQNLYKAILQRTGDTGGIDYWVARADAGLTAAAMANSFIGSPEAQNVTAVLHLYDVFFNRAADSGGLGYWVNALNSGTSLLDIAKGFSASSEFQARFASASTADYVEATYGNIFGRESDAAGKAHWVQKLDSGTLNRAEVGLAFTLSPEALASGGAATRFTESYLVLRASGTVDPTTSAVEALATKTLAVALAEMITGYDAATFKITGKIVDGYLSGATVFADANGDGVWNEGEATATTDAKGNFSLDGAKGALVASGGTDLSTGKAFKGVLKAPEGSTMVNPLTSLQQAFVEKGLSVADAELKVAKALGLDASKFDLTTYDPLAVSLDANASAADRALGAELQAQAAKVANLLVAAGSTLIGAAGGADKLDMATASKSLIDAMVKAIVADSDGVVSFSDQAMLKGIMNEAATHSGDSDLSAAATKVAGLADAFAAMSAASADNVDKAVAAGGDVNAMMANIAQSSVVAQGTMADQMQAAAAAGNLSSMQSEFTGAAFDDLANKAVIGDLNPDSTTDDAAAAKSNAGTGGPVTPAPGGGGGSGAATPTGQGSRAFPAANETAYSDVIDANQSTITAIAKVFNAANGNDEYVINADTSTQAANIRISGFGSGDKLVFSAALTATLATLNTLYSVADNGIDVSLYANNAGNVQYITMAGLSASRVAFGGGVDSVSELSSFLGAGSIALISTFSTADETSGNDVINANQMNILTSAKTFNAANGNDEYVINADTATQAANVRISGFGRGDKLVFDTPASATLSTLDALYTIADNGSDISLYANNVGNVQYITLVGVAGSRAALGGGIDSVSELASFLGNDAIAFI